MDSRFVVPPRSVFLAAVLVAACGGGSSPSSPSYPAIKGTYGSYSGTVEGSSVTSIPDQSGQHTGVVNLAASSRTGASSSGATTDRSWRSRSS